eukprot:TRINITY_DN5641_c1_g1_i2.p2 TRINITY_DN5641_c1_g1~~TRINITY_DN5641_c1_g1_i2.p2  ORF type:complete len:304 (+),score=-25.02 TRINITY_DN5641_c1_g1_i2:3499-4410(+)
MKNVLCYTKGTTLSTDTLRAYMQWVNSIPMLSAEEEQALATAWLTQESLEAARKLVLSHLRLVVKIARSYAGYGLQQVDIIQEGTIGLMKAIKRFNPTLGIRLVSFAVHWIRAEIHEYIIRNWRIVKIATTKAQRKLFFNIRKMSKKNDWFDKAEVEAVAEVLQVPAQEVCTMEARLHYKDASLDAPPENTDASEVAPPQESYFNLAIEGPECELEYKDWEYHQRLRLTLALGSLDPREKKIITVRWLLEQKTETLQSLGELFSISAERVRQLEKKALAKLNTAMEETEGLSLTQLERQVKAL